MAKTASEKKKGGIRIPLKFQVAGLLAFFVAVLGLISIRSTIDYLEQNKTSQVREIQNLQVTRQISELGGRWEKVRDTLTEQAFRLLDPARGSVALPEGWRWLRVGDKISQNPQNTETVSTFPGAPAKREFLLTPANSGKTFYVFLPLDIKQGGGEKQEWAMAEVARAVVLGKESNARSAIQQVLINTHEIKSAAGEAELARSTWMGASESVRSLAQLFSLVPPEDRKAMLSFSPQPVAREIVLGDKAGYIVSWASLPTRSSEVQLTLITFVDRESLLKSFRSFVVKQSFFAFLILGAGFIFALLIARRLARPVEEMVGAAKILETGDFKVRVNINRNDEIGDLAGAFNHMGQALQEREEALQQAQNTIIQNEKLAAIGTLSAGIAHEVKNPLAGILGNADLVSNQIRKLNLPNAGPLLNYIEVIQKETKRCRGIIDSLMKFSRQEKATYDAMDLEVVLWETIQLIEHSLNLNKVTVIKDFADDYRMIDGNANQIEQTFLNMIQNAGHAMPEGGTVTLSTRYFADPASAPTGKFVALKSEQFQGPFCRVCIGDTGIGMTDEVLRKIFEPFFTTKPKGVGTGLGLAVTLGILADHKARISIDSAPGKGTTFYMDFMAKSERSSSVVHELEEIKKKAGGGATVSTDVTATVKKVLPSDVSVKTEMPKAPAPDLNPFPTSENPSDKSVSKSLRPPPPPKREKSQITQAPVSNLREVQSPLPDISLDMGSGLSTLSLGEESPMGLGDSPSPADDALPKAGWLSNEDHQATQKSLIVPAEEMKTNTTTNAPGVEAARKKFQIKKPQAKRNG